MGHEAENSQVTRMQAAIAKAVAVGPQFLKGEVDVDHMTHTMVEAVRTYAQEEEATGGDGTPRSAQAQELQQTLQELYACGSGFRAGRCDAACVARTMTYMVQEYGKTTAA